MTYPYYFAFGNNEKRAGLKGRGLHTLTIRLQNSLSGLLTLPRIAVIMGTSGRDNATAARPADQRPEQRA